MFHDLLLGGFLFSGIFFISAMLLIGVFYSSTTTKIEYLQKVRKLCSLQYVFIDKRYLENIDLFLLDHRTLLARWGAQAVPGESELPMCC